MTGIVTLNLFQSSSLLIIVHLRNLNHIILLLKQTTIILVTFPLSTDDSKLFIMTKRKISPKQLYMSTFTYNNYCMTIIM